VQVVRYLVVFLAGLIAGSRAVDAVQAWQAWQSWAIRDPSGAGAYRTFFWVDVAMSLASLLIAGLVWQLLRPKPG
jgi:hypothetical protein